MEHLLLKAATTATDQGTFTAVISTASVDRDRDIIEPAAMVASLAKWAGLGKLVPLAYNHTDEVVGHIDPASARIENKEVVVDGFVDQSIERGKDVWRLVKSGTLSFSFGYLFEPEKAQKLANGGYRVKELDIFEISAIPIAPANNDTRVLSFKGLTEEALTKELDELKARLATVEQQLEDNKAAEEAGKETKSRPDDSLKQKAAGLVMELLADGAKPPERVTKEPAPRPDMDPEELKRRSRDLVLQMMTST